MNAISCKVQHECLEDVISTCCPAAHVEGIDTLNNRLCTHSSEMCVLADEQSNQSHSFRWVSLLVIELVP